MVAWMESASPRTLHDHRKIGQALTMCLVEGMLTYKRTHTHTLHVGRTAREAIWAENKMPTLSTYLVWGVGSVGSVRILRSAWISIHRLR